MKKRFGLLVGLILLAGAHVYAVPDSVFQIKPVYGKQVRVVASILETGHYRKLPFNDSLSSVVLDSYLSSLDNSKIYFLKSDINTFEKYRNQLDDLARAERVEPAFDIYKIFQKRFSERMDYVMKHLVGKEFDFTTDEYYETNREKAPWPANVDELNAIWTQIIKNQALSLKLAGKTQPEIKDALEKRYERFIKSMSQTTGDDIFSTYLNAIAESYDPHTNYFSPRTADVFKQNMAQSFEGIGARLQSDNDYTKIAEIIPGGPAEKSKLLHANDRIIGVAQGDGGEMVDVIGWRLDEVVKLIKGPKGTRVRLNILPAETGVTGPPVVITLVRDKIKLEDLTAKKQVVDYTKDGKQLKLGVITLPGFYMDWEAYQKGDPNYNSTSGDVKKHIKDMQAQGIDGLVLDLRNNGGGSLKEAVDLTGLFIRKGPVVQVRNSMKRTEVLEDDDNNVLYNGPLIVLINRFSASASEIFAGAMQDYGRGVVVGESSYGKGTVQTMVELDRFIQDKDNAGSLKLTIQKFYRINGSSTQHKGVIPDIKMPSALDSDQFGESSNPAALPWDEIRGTLYQRTPYINSKVLTGLTRTHQERLKTDARLLELVSQTEEVRRNLNQTKVSLNEEQRKKEMEEAERKVSATRKPGNVQLDKEGKPVSGTLNMEDEYLREGLLILSDLISSRIG
ncbi:MAG: carboxy terminal-processing peptidase [Cyclobacteriaceae bacterium]|nr:carboxy terminal-processing peptidase [Cyclobacteriaceae bacterium]